VCPNRLLALDACAKDASFEDKEKVSVRHSRSFVLAIGPLPIAIDRERIARFCHERGLRSLVLFGSVLRMISIRSEAMSMWLAEFAPRALWGWVVLF